MRDGHKACMEGIHKQPHKAGTTQPIARFIFSKLVLDDGAHHVLSANRKRFERDANTKSAKYFRILNEVPTVLMLAIVFLVVLKPF